MALEVRGLSKRFGEEPVVDGVDLRVEHGGLMALLGPSGCGKSTLLRLIAGLESPDAGAVILDGRDITRSPARARGIGLVFQDAAPFRHMTLAENVAFPLSVRRVPADRVRSRVEELLALVHLDGLEGRRPAQLSGGELQRMAFARSLAADPKVLLLDEPFAALDAPVRAELREWLRALHRRVGLTTVLVTHDQEEAMLLGDRLALMNRGRIEQQGTPRELAERPGSEFAAAFISPRAAASATPPRLA